MSRRAQVPAVAAEYFRRHPLATPGVVEFDNGRAARLEERHPVIVAAFRPDKGWRRYPLHKRISASWARKMLAEGYTDVQLQVGKVRADFSVRSLTR